MLLLWGPIKAPLKINCAPPGGEGVLPYERLMGCAAGWGLIFPTGLTKMGSIIGHRIDYNGVGAKINPSYHHPPPTPRGAPMPLELPLF